MHEPEWTHDRLKPCIYRPARDRPSHYERKFDGVRITFFKQPNGQLVAYGRQIEPHLERMSELAAAEGRDWLWTIRDTVPPHTSIDGEIWAPGTPCTGVVTKIKAKSPDLRFTPFAMPYCGGQWYGHQPFEEVDRRLEDFGLVPPARSLFRPEKHTPSWLTGYARELGIEGFVLKAGQYHSWWKLKQTHTVDAVVMAIVPGEGKHTGRAGAIVVGLYHEYTVPIYEGADCVGSETEYHLQELCHVGTGFTDDDREDLDENDIGRTVEVEYQSVAAQGGLQHPRFIRFRDDKPAAECTPDQLVTPERNDEESI